MVLVFFFSGGGLREKTIRLAVWLYGKVCGRGRFFGYGADSVILFIVVIFIGSTVCRVGF